MCVPRSIGSSNSTKNDAQSDRCHHNRPQRSNSMHSRGHISVLPMSAACEADDICKRDENNTIHFVVPAAYDLTNSYIELTCSNNTFLRLPHFNSPMTFDRSTAAPSLPHCFLLLMVAADEICKTITDQRTSDKINVQTNLNSFHANPSSNQRHSLNDPDSKPANPTREIRGKSSPSRYPGLCKGPIGQCGVLLNTPSYQRAGMD